jgi:hypothetical protein
MGESKRSRGHSEGCGNVVFSPSSYHSYFVLFLACLFSPGAVGCVDDGVPDTVLVDVLFCISMTVVSVRQGTRASERLKREYA